MPRTSVPALALALAALGLHSPAAHGQACDDFSAYKSCPPPAARCLLGPNPDSCAQDCSTCKPGVDDDGDGVSDEEILNDQDDDGDGLIDEDISCLNTCDPLNFSCPTTPFPPSEFTAPSPLAGPLTLAARIDHWSCAAGDSLDDVDVEMEPEAGNPNPACGSYRVVLRLRAAGGGAVHFEGPALLIHTRRWESLDRSLVAGASGTVQGYRYLIKADLKRLTPFAQLPPALQVPCNADQATRKHLFFYGYLDLVRDASAPLDRTRYRTALALYHAPGAMSHPLADYDPAKQLCGFADMSQRGIPRGSPEAHDDQGWFIVAPGAGFAFSAAGPVPVGDFLEGRIHQVPNGPGECRKETLIGESHFDGPAPGGTCPSRLIERSAHFCGQDDGSSPCPHFNLVSATKCDTIPDDRLAFAPVGQWSGSEFPAGTRLSFLEGGWICRANFEPYWYGVYTEMGGAPFWRGPEHALDVVDNQQLDVTFTTPWLIGSCNWLDEGGPNERFAPRQFRTMYFFPSVNPDIPRLAPCAAKAVASPAAPGLCGGGDLALSGLPSTLENCCQCGGPEYHWLKRVGGTFVEVAPWGTDPEYRESPGPSTDTDYQLEVRCSHSRNACVDRVVVPVSVGQPAADAGPDVSLCQGGPGVRIGAAAIAGRTYAWTPGTGLDDASAARPMAAPAVTTTYTVRVAYASDPGCFSEDAVDVGVDPPPGRITLLHAVRQGIDAHFQWSEDPAASGGYHVYRVLSKVDIASAPAVGVRVIDTPAGSTRTSGDDPGTVPGPGGTVFFYQAVSACADDVTEGPL